MTTFIKVKLKKSDNKTNIDKYRVAANITENNIPTKINLPKNYHFKFMIIRLQFRGPF